MAAAYGWADWAPAMPDEDLLRRLLALDRERAAGEADKASHGRGTKARV